MGSDCGAVCKVLPKQHPCLIGDATESTLPKCGWQAARTPGINDSGSKTDRFDPVAQKVHMISWRWYRFDTGSLNGMYVGFIAKPGERNPTLISNTSLPGVLFKKRPSSHDPALQASCR